MVCNIIWKKTIVVSKLSTSHNSQTPFKRNLTCILTVRAKLKKTQIISSTFRLFMKGKFDACVTFDHKFSKFNRVYCSRLYSLYLGKWKFQISNWWFTSCLIFFCLTLIGMRQGGFTSLIILGLDFVSWIFIKNFQTFWR